MMDVRFEGRSMVGECLYGRVMLWMVLHAFDERGEANLVARLEKFSAVECSRQSCYDMRRQCGKSNFLCNLAN